MKPRPRQRGFTLIELVMSIIIIGIAVTGVMMVMTQTVMRSADPMLLEQATAIAEAYMEEIMVKEYADPDGVTATEASRALYDDVDDYNLASHAPVDQLGNAIAPLSAYRVTVTVGGAANVASGAGTGQAMKQISITVTHTQAAGVSYTLDGYRASW